MIETQIVYFGKEVALRCDGKCHKAFGIQNRPELKLSDDEDDTVDLADDEVGTAPEDPGTYECGHAKPTDKVHNKWCARQCERSSFDKDPPDYSKRVYNMHVRQQAADLGLDEIANTPDIKVVHAALKSEYT